MGALIELRNRFVSSFWLLENNTNRRLEHNLDALSDTEKNDLEKKVAEVFITKRSPVIAMNCVRVKQGSMRVLSEYELLRERYQDVTSVRASLPC